MQPLRRTGAVARVGVWPARRNRFLVLVFSPGCRIPPVPPGHTMPVTHAAGRSLSARTRRVWGGVVLPTSPQPPILQGRQAWVCQPREQVILRQNGPTPGVHFGLVMTLSSVSLPPRSPSSPRLPPPLPSPPPVTRPVEGLRPAVRLAAGLSWPLRRTATRQVARTLLVVRVLARRWPATGTPRNQQSLSVPMMTPIPAAGWQRRHSRSPSNREMASVFALAMSGAAAGGVLFPGQDGERGWVPPRGDTLTSHRRTHYEECISWGGEMGRGLSVDRQGVGEIGGDRKGWPADPLPPLKGGGRGACGASLSLCACSDLPTTPLGRMQCTPSRGRTYGVGRDASHWHKTASNTQNTSTRR